MAGNPLASLPGLPQRPSLARSAASETRLTQPGIEVVRSRKLNPAPTAAFRMNGEGYQDLHFRRGNASTITLRTRPLPDGSFRLDLPGGSMRAETRVDDEGARFLLDGVVRRLAVVRRGAELTVIIAGRNHVLVQEDPLAPPRTETVGDERVTAPIPGRVARVMA